MNKAELERDRIMEKRKVNSSFLHNSFRCIKLVAKIDLKNVLLYILITTVYALTWVFKVMALQNFFDTASKFLLGEVVWNQLIFSLAILGLVYMFYHIMDGLSNCQPEIINLRLNKYLNKLIFKRIDSLGAEEFESTEKLDIINKALNGSTQLVWVSFALLDIVFYYVAYFFYMGGYLFSLKPVLVLSILIVFIPCIAAKIASITLFKELEDKIAPLRRQTAYYEKCQTDKEYLKETRILGANHFFMDKYLDSLKAQNLYVFKTELKKNMITIGLDILTVSGYGVIIWMLFISVMTHEISIGAFAAVLTSLGDLFRFMNKMISERLGWATENVGNVENFLDFIEEADKKKRDIDRPDAGDYVLKNVSFQYPMSKEKALDNVNLIIPGNEIVAVVGENGSGKTTLARIIMGLYEPTEGQTLYGKNKITDYSFQGVSAVFQRYCKYNMTLKKNITISSAQKKTADNHIIELCKTCGIEVSNITDGQGLDTMLGREFEGTEISGGQWQRVAIARGIYRDAGLILLDEPTAAIDPLEETRLYRDFAVICKGKTSVLITHRLGSVKMADRIIVMKNGKVVQNGTHENLVNVEGEYKKLYEAQKMWYI